MAKNKKQQLVSFATVKKFEYSDFLDIQLKSFRDFFQLETDSENRKNEGLYKVFSDSQNSYLRKFVIFVTFKILQI